MDIQPIALYYRIVRRWPWVFIAAVAGGLIGIGISRLTPQSYRATAIVDIGIDYGRSEWLDEDAERHVMNRIQTVLLADDTLQATLRSLDGGGMVAGLSVNDLRSRIRLVRIEASWRLMATDQSPEVAAEIANAWAESALEEISQAVQHAWQAAELQRIFFEVSCRPESIEEPIQRSLWVCDETDPFESDQSLLGDLLQEVELSRGLPPVISYSFPQEAVPQYDPLNTQRDLLALAGTVLGLAIAAVLAIAYPGKADSLGGVTNAKAAPDRNSDPLEHKPE